MVGKGVDLVDQTDLVDQVPLVQGADLELDLAFLPDPVDFLLLLVNLEADYKDLIVGYHLILSLREEDLVTDL